jgi:hypothetical protein
VLPIIAIFPVRLPRSIGTGIFQNTVKITQAALIVTTSSTRRSKYRGDTVGRLPVEGKPSISPCAQGRPAALGAVAGSTSIT